MFSDPTYWHWLILACIFIGFEIVTPGAFFLWLGLAAGASALVEFVFPNISGLVQYALFAAFCIISLFLWKRFGKSTTDVETDQPQLNQRNQQYVGRTIALSEAIESGVGMVRIDDSQWKVSGADAPSGSMVKVTHVDGSILHVELV